MNLGFSWGPCLEARANANVSPLKGSCLETCAMQRCLHPGARALKHESFRIWNDSAKVTVPCTCPCFRLCGTCMPFSLRGGREPWWNDTTLMMNLRPSKAVVQTHESFL
eukprot:1145769-Pelagomonas_calceolata.AAC.2